MPNNLISITSRRITQFHGFSREELNTHFASVSVSPLKNIESASDVIRAAREDGFALKSVSTGGSTFGSQEILITGKL